MQLTRFPLTLTACFLVMNLVGVFAGGHIVIGGRWSRLPAGTRALAGALGAIAVIFAAVAGALVFGVRTGERT